jgi:RNA polymerase sigma-70 factor (ECF subfamily)
VAGQRLEFRAFYDEWAEHVARWIRALGCPAADRDDMLQEVFVVVHRRLPDFDGRHAASWLYRITTHRVRDFRRSRWIASIFGPSRNLTPESWISESTPFTALEARDKQALLERLLGALTSSQRVAFVLFELDGYTAEEIARVQDAPVNTVRARVFRARQKVTLMLEKRRLRVDGGYR